MNDIFISYGKADRAVAQQMADALEALGWSIFWDREIPFGKSFDQVIEHELTAASCVIVLWSRDSVRSRWVKTEAAAAADRDRLIPVVIDDVPLPFEFNRIQSAMLRGWNGDRTDPEFLHLVDSIRQMLEQPAIAHLSASPQRLRIPAPLSKRGNKLALGGGALALALIALLIAKSPFRATEDDASQRSNDPVAISSQSGQRADSITSSGGNAPAEAGNAASSAPSVAAGPIKGAFAIKIGDRIDDGVPGPGAGNIERPGAKDVYTFSAAPGQRVYFRMLKHEMNMEQISWVLTDADGMVVFDSRLYTEPGVQLLRKGGIYTLTVGSDRVPATGAYGLQLFNVPPPHQFAIKVGDKIRDDAPGSGAGYIESPGVKDVYTFAAAAGQRVYFRNFEHGKGMEQIRWALADSDGMEVFDSRLYTEPGVQLLRRAGTYTLTVGSDQVPATGTYHLQLFNVPPPHQFAVKIGDMIRENVPGPGAGHIESPGVKDIYTFMAAPGQQVYFRMLEHDRGMEQIAWRLTDSDDIEVFESRLYTEPGAQVLRKGGTYTLTVGSDQNPAMGTYRLQLSSTPGSG